MSWSRTGSVAVTQGSNAVIGTGTDFLKNSRVGDAFIGPDGAQYEVINIPSDTSLAITPNYLGPSTGAGAYAIVPIQGYNKETADALREASRQVGDALDGMEESVQSAADSAAAALASKNVAGTSETNAVASANSALASKNAAGISETNAASSASAALTSKNSAADSAAAANTSKNTAADSASAASTSATAAAASAATAANLGVGKGFIEGLQMAWVSLTSIQVLPGSCYMPNLSRVYKVPNALTVTPPAGVTGFGHIYLYDNAGAPALEMVTTEPVVYWSDSYSKTGDATRRYIGSVLLNSGNSYKFRHYPNQSRMQYLYGTPQTAPFLLLSGGAATSATQVAASGVCPITATHVEALVSAGGASGNYSIGNDETANPLAANQWLFIGIPSGYMQLSIPLSQANTLRQFQYMVTSPTSCFIASNGYLFRR